MKNIGTVFALFLLTMLFLAPVLVDHYVTTKKSVVKSIEPSPGGGWPLGTYDVYLTDDKKVVRTSGWIQEMHLKPGDTIDVAVPL